MTKPRYELLDGIRGVAAISVMIYHYSIVMDVHAFGRTAFTNAPLAVDLFFMLSGFVIAASYYERLRLGMGLYELFEKRIIRLYPLFFLSVLLYIGVSYSTGDLKISDFNIIKVLFLNALFIPYLHAPVINNVFPVNTPAWSLSFELMISCLYFSIARLAPQRTGRLIFISYIALLISGFVIAALEGQPGVELDSGWSTLNYIGGIPRVVFGFTTGVYIYYLRSSKIKTEIAAYILKYVKIQSVTIYCTILAILLFPLTYDGIYQIAIITFIFPTVVLVSAQQYLDNPYVILLNNVSGKLSYPIYCLHVPVYMIIRTVIADNERLHGLPALILCSATTILVSGLVVWLYDQPVRKYLTQFSGSAAGHRPPRTAHS